MKNIKLCLSLLLVAGVLCYTIAPLSAAEIKLKPGVLKPGVISVVVLNNAGTYCHLKFPAIVPGTLSSAKPQLQDAKTGEIVDFYGPCDHDPVGYDEVCRQKVVNASRQFCD